jgi:hypothetical protein
MSVFFLFKKRKREHTQWLVGTFLFDPKKKEGMAKPRCTSKEF